MFLKLIKTLLLSSVILIACSKGDSFNSVTANAEIIKTGPGPEDILWDSCHGRNRLLVSCDQRRAGLPPFGEIMAIDLKDNRVSTLQRYGEPEGLPFFPHGFYLQTVSDESLLYVINHYKDGNNTNSVLVYKLAANSLEFVREYQDPLMISPNEVCAMKDGSFYFSNDKGGPDLITENLFNKFGGSLVYCTKEGSCRYVDEQLAFPNGIEYKDNQLFVGTTRHQALFRYDRNEDGSLSNRTRINNTNGIDNLRWSDGQLIAAIHPDEIAFVAHSLREQSKTPTLILSINPVTGASKRVFQDDGRRINGGSTGIIIKNKLYISQVFEDFVLQVDLSQ
jgi:arylesterase / paraoxonase